MSGKTQSDVTALLEAQPGIAQVQRFWEAHPLFALESPFQVGTAEFFAWHDKVRRDEVEAFSMHLYEFDHHTGDRVLDIGCGIGWLCSRFASNGAQIVGVDLTRRALELTRQRLGLNHAQATLVQTSAEQLPFQSNSFDFITCAGVLHHTPAPLQAISEIHRVLRPGGRVMISLYYKNWLLSRRVWPLTRLLVRAVLRRHRGRSAFRQVHTADDFVRIYDGDENPLGRAYSLDDVRTLLDEFTIERMEVHYFPRRFLPFGRLLARPIHRALDRWCGTMMYLLARKPG